MRTLAMKQWALAVSMAVMLALLTGGCGSSNKTKSTGKKGKGSGKSSSSTSGSKAKTGKDDGKKLKIAFVTNQIAEFWNIAAAGCRDAEKEFGVSVDVKMPEKATAEIQKRIIEDLLSRGVQGIAVSPLDANNQTEFLNGVGDKIKFITHDSDAPKSNRLMYIGMDNYKAGRKVGELVKKALPKGGNVMIFIGRLEQDNSKHRRQGVIDELLGRDKAEGKFSPVGKPIKGDKYTIMGTITDGGDQTVAKSKAADAINAHPTMNAMVGLFEYNPPAIYSALQQANKLGKIHLIGFDENELTLQAIKDGTCVGTVVQNPYEYGYRSVEVLTKLLRGDESVIPKSKFVDIEARVITKENVDKFWAKLKSLKGQ